MCSHFSNISGILAPEKVNWAEFLETEGKSRGLHTSLPLLRHSHGEKGAALEPWQRESLREIDLATDRLNRLTEDLLDAVRLQAGRLHLYRESIDLVEITMKYSPAGGKRATGSTPQYSGLRHWHSPF